MPVVCVASIFYPGPKGVWVEPVYKFISDIQSWTGFTSKVKDENETKYKSNFCRTRIIIKAGDHKILILAHQPHIQSKKGYVIR
jgi:hypothetical protein